MFSPDNQAPSRDAPGSRPVRSNQHGPHPRLADVVERHLRAPARAPVAAHNRAAFEALCGALAGRDRPLVLDSFCGTGRSTARLAARYPDHLVVGIDKSAHRLGRHGAPTRDNYLLLRADCEALWQLLALAGLRADHHYLLYPNPWPKSRHLMRRVHGHPAFPRLLAVGGRLELRSNWRLYVEEFGAALRVAGHPGSMSELAARGPALSPFERKYRDSGHTLWSCTVRLPP